MYDMFEEEVLNFFVKEVVYILSKRIVKVKIFGILWGKIICKFVNEFLFILYKDLIIILFIGGMGLSDIDLYFN